jgi:hypothetical protein
MMLRFSIAQQDAFMAASEALFEQRLLTRLRQFFPGFDARSDHKDVAYVRRGVARAKRYGITSQRDVSEYLGLMAHWGEDFDEATRDPVVLATLHNIAGPPRRRMEILMHHAADHEICI